MLRLLAPGALGLVLFVLLAVAEVLVVVRAERGDNTPWHPGHVAERFGLFTLIVLGESLLASANAIFEALAGSEHTVELVVLAGSALVVVAGLWWTYFWVPQEDRVVDLRAGIRFSLLHFLIFGAAAAVSAGIEAAVDVLEDHSELGDVAAAATLTVPVAVFLLGVWVLAIHDRADAVVDAAVPVAAVVVLLTTLLPGGAVWTALAVVALVAVLVVHPPRDQEPAPA